MNLSIEFGKSAHKARKKLGYTQSQVAEAVVISVRWYQKIESGQGVPGFEVGMQIVSLLYIKLEDFWKEEWADVPVSSI